MIKISLELNKVNSLIIIIKLKQHQINCH